MIRSKITDMHAHVNFIREFVTDHVLKTNFGYYLTTVEGALAHIESMEKGMTF